jgi:hypothetical protein
MIRGRSLLLSTAIAAAIAAALLLFMGALSHVNGAPALHGYKQGAAPEDEPIIVKGKAATRVGADKVLPDAALVAPSMSENFEGVWPATGWTVEDLSNADGGQYMLNKRNCHPHQGGFAGWTVGGGVEGGALPCSGNYPNNLDTWATYGPFDLRNVISASLTFYLWGSSQGQEGCPTDYLFVGYSTDNYSYSGAGLCGNFTQGTDGNGYHKVTLNLNEQLGQSQVWVGFAMISDGSINTYGGFTVDDIRLTSRTAPTPEQCLQQGAWYGEYFNNTSLQGSPVFTRCDPDVDFYWRSGSPDAEFPTMVDNFSVRWRKTVNFAESGWYRFRTFTDDGVRLYVDGTRIINDWNGQNFTENSKGQQLTGAHEIKMEYLEIQNDAIAHLTWYLCPNGSGDCDMNLPAIYQTHYTNEPMPTTCKDWQKMSPQQSLFNWGCMVTSWVMALKEYGVDTNPRELNKWLSENGGYQGEFPGDTCTAFLKPNAILKFAEWWGKEHGQIIKFQYGANLTSPVQLIRSETPVVMGVKPNAGGQPSHWVLAVDVVKDSAGHTVYGVNDPWSSYGCKPIQSNGTVQCAAGPLTPTQHETLLPGVKLGNYSTYKYLELVEAPAARQAGASFDSSISYTAISAEILLTDSQGRRTGYDPATDQFLEEIPGSLYFDDKIVPPGGTDDGQVVRSLILTDDAGGKFTLQVIGVGNVARGSVAPTATAYAVSAYGIDNQYTVTTADLFGEIQAGQVAEYQVDFQPGSDLKMGEHTYLPLVGNERSMCGQFVWFSLGIDTYPGSQVYNSGETWFFDEFALGTMPPEGSYAVIVGPQFMSQEFAPGIKWLSGAESITPVANCQP